MKGLARASCLALLALCGCARNAFLELQIDLPALPAEFKAKTGDRYANIRVVSGEVPFEQDWQVDAPLPSPLLGTSPTVERVSIESTKDSETRPVRIKVRFCKDPTCTALGDDTAPEVRLQIDRAFYIGQRTSFNWKITCVPNVATQTDAPPVCDVAQNTITTAKKCDVAGCRSGKTSTFCTGDKHFCEP